MQRKWSEAEDEILNARTELTAKELAVLLRRSDVAVSQRLARVSGENVGNCRRAQAAKSFRRMDCKRIGYGQGLTQTENLSIGSARNVCR